MSNDRLDLTGALLLTLLCLVWGLNAVAIKVSNAGIAPIFGAAFRSLLASMCLAAWMAARRIPFFPGRILDGAVVGLLFGAEFALLYASLLWTTASSAWILLYTTPFFHALGAHWFLEGDRLTRNKVLGLTLAFGGVVLLLARHLGLPSRWALLGDAFALGSGILWAMTTIYIKRRLVNAVTPYHTLFYQILFSVPLLFALSGFLESHPIGPLSGLILLSVAYQAVIIAFLSYLLWFYMVHTYPVSGLSAFTFLTPLFATLAGALFLAEPITGRLLLSLAMVSGGIYLVNRP